MNTGSENHTTCLGDSKLEAAAVCGDTTDINGAVIPQDEAAIEAILK
ncbi:MAG: hypothetical protein U9Q15_00530 [Patescibacteria group bacterium]|nr:hypothetical protein [Patescibacteria group bacterium]